MRKGWSFSDPNGIEQCVDEGWVDKMQEQNTEGCRIDGRVRVNKVGFSHGFLNSIAFYETGTNI